MVYIDVVMVLNFIVDFLLILSANSLSGYPPGYGRAAIAASIGGVYGGVCLLQGFSFLGSTFWRLVILAVMAILAFGWDRSALRRGILFAVLSMALGGVAIGLNSRGGIVLIAAAAGVYGVCLIGLRGKITGRKFSKVELCCANKKRELMALQDTGNTLRDPVTGAPVLVAGAEVAWDLLGLSAKQLASPIETMLLVPGLRLIPYRAVGQPGGMLLAIKMDEVRINDRKWDGLVAFAPQKLGSEGYEALAGGMI